MLSSVAIKKAAILKAFYDVMVKSSSMGENGASVDIQYFKFFLKTKVDKTPWSGPVEVGVPASSILSRFNQLVNSKKFDIEDFEYCFMRDAVNHYLCENHGLVVKRVYYKTNLIFFGTTGLPYDNKRFISKNQYNNSTKINFKNSEAGVILDSTIIKNILDTRIEEIEDPIGVGEDLDSKSTIEEKEDIFKNKKLDKIENIEVNGETFYFPSFAPEILDCIGRRNNIYIYGPQGCGKSQMSRLLVKSLEVKPYEIDFSAGVDEASFLGTKIASVDENGNNVIEFQYGVFPKAVKEGVPIIVNEIDFAKPQYLAALHGILEENDPKLVLLDNGGEILRPDPESSFMVIATANTIGLGDDMDEFHGTGSLNSAFLDRFDSFFEVGYTSKEKDIAKCILDDDKATTDIIDFVNAVRKLKASSSISSTISTRRLKMLCKRIVSLGLKKSVENVILNRLDLDDRDAIKEVAQRVFPKYF